MDEVGDSLTVCPGATSLLAGGARYVLLYLPALARCQVQWRARVVVAHVDRDLLLLQEPLHRVEVALGGGIDEVSGAGVRPFGAVRGPRVAQRLRGLVVVPDR